MKDGRFEPLFGTRLGRGSSHAIVVALNEARASREVS